MRPHPDNCDIWVLVIIIIAMKIKIKHFTQMYLHDQIMGQNIFVQIH
jgi:hypothetical protein